MPTGGASAYAPENTFAAFDRALALGASHVEFDLHFSGDGHVVVIHDETLDRTTNGTGAVAETTLAEVAIAGRGLVVLPRVRGREGPRPSGRCWNGTRAGSTFTLRSSPMLPVCPRRAADLVRGYGVADSATITSFNLSSIEEVTAYAPELPAGLLVVEVTDWTVEQAQRLGLKLPLPSFRVPGD